MAISLDFDAVSEIRPCEQLSGCTEGGLHALRGLDGEVERVDGPEDLVHFADLLLVLEEHPGRQVAPAPAKRTQQMPRRKHQHDDEQPRVSPTRGSTQQSKVVSEACLHISVLALKWGTFALVHFTMISSLRRGRSGVSHSRE